jgi:4-oxalocrotonate tautomerase
MPLIHVTLFAARTTERKRAFAQALTEAKVRSIGAPPETVDVIFTDAQRSDWATASRLWSDPPAAPSEPGRTG